MMSLAVLPVAMSQNITLKFSGATAGGDYVQLDSVQVQNVSRSWTETVVYPDTVLSFQQTGLADAQGLAAELSSYPNPFNGTTNLSVAMPQSGEATLQLYNLAGQRVAERSMTLQAGSNNFEVRLQNAHVYLLAVTTEQGHSTIKLLDRGMGSENNILFRGNVNTSEKRQSSNPFQSGDMLKIVGYATHNGYVVLSNEIQQPQTTSEDFTLIFALPVAPVAPTVTTTSASNITDSSATTGGNVTADGGATVTVRGLCYGTSQNPTVSGTHTTDGTGTGAFTSNLTGLTPGTTYYVRAYATNAVGTSYGNQITFTTGAVAPTVTTTSASNVTSTSATTGGNVTADGGANVTARGVCYGTSQNPTVSGTHTTNGTGTGAFTSNLTGLTPGTTYYVRAYATNSAGTSYGSQITFTTGAVVPTVTTTAASYISSISANTDGNITSDGGSAVTARGVCYGTSQNPTVTGSHTTNGTGTGSFTSIINRLSPGTTYYVRAYATNAVGTSYGNQIPFSTLVYLPIVLLGDTNNLTATGFSIVNSEITYTGGADITARGVCWGISRNPTVSGSHTSNGTGSTMFSNTITGLTPNTTYYIRAYATNSAGTAYSSQLTITTTKEPPVVSDGYSSRVEFSHGNLQYSTKNGGSSYTTHVVAGGGTEIDTWRFATNQWDYIGSANSNASSTYSGWIDLFGWGTSGYHNTNDQYNTHSYPFHTANTISGTRTYNEYGYSPSTNMTDAYLTGTSANYDWGVYNSIYTILKLKLPTLPAYGVRFQKVNGLIC